VLGVVTEADLLLKQEYPDPESNVPPIWSRRRRREWKKAAAVVADKLMTAPATTVSPTATLAEAAPASAHRRGPATAGGRRDGPAGRDRQPR
jgi:CBS domain-containing protein